MTTRIAPFRRLLLSGFLLAAAAIAGCGPAGRAPFQAADAEPFAELKLAKASQHANLRDELTRLEAAGETPLLLDAGYSEGNDLGRDLLAALPRHQHSALTSEINRLWPQGRFTMSPLERQQTADTLNRRRDTLNAIRALLPPRDKKFCYRFRQGLLADTAFVDAARLAVRLEGLAAAEAMLTMESPRLADAITSLDRMLEWTARVGQVKHPLPRMAAADLRGDALAVAEAIAQHPRATADELLQLRSLVDRELNRWPLDSQAWIGERAVALHTYELIRDGQLLSILSIDEIAQARKKGSVHALGESVAANINHDEFFYLTEMHQIIADCRRPFYERTRTLRDLERKVRSLEGTPEHPFVAARVLLPGISAGHRRQAEDLAHALQWSIALSIAVGQTPAAHLDPTNGLPYIVTREETRVVVSRPGRAGELDRAVIAPLMEKRKPAETARRP